MDVRLSLASVATRIQERRRWRLSEKCRASFWIRPLIKDDEGGDNLAHLAAWRTRDDSSRTANGSPAFPVW